MFAPITRDDFEAIIEREIDAKADYDWRTEVISDQVLDALWPTIEHLLVARRKSDETVCAWRGEVLYVKDTGGRVYHLVDGGESPARCGYKPANRVWQSSYDQETWAYNRAKGVPGLFACRQCEAMGRGVERQRRRKRHGL